MNILNLMFGKGRGGLEQAALDYHEALTLAGHHVTTLTHSRAAINPALASIGASVQCISPRGEWDIVAKWKLRNIARATSPNLVIAHGNRAIGLALSALRFHAPVVGVAHNYNIKKRFPKCDAVFCITRDLIEEMVHLDIDRHKTFHIPNMIRVGDLPVRSGFRDPLVIGTLGRFVPKKGFDSFLQAIQALKAQGVSVRAIIGGEGEQGATLKALARDYGIEDSVEFCGWVTDKTAFFQSMDVFVLPSYHEPFGIVLIEAMAAGVPCITTDTEGPCEIITHEVDAIMVEKAKPHQMAQAIIEILHNPELSAQMGMRAYYKARDKYGIDVVSAQLDRAAKAVAS